MSIKRILVGIDDSLSAKAALEFAIDLGRSVGAEIIACHAIGKVPRAIDGHLTTLDQYRSLVVQKFEDEWCRPLAESGLRFQTIVVDGNPVVSLLTIADEEEADMIILGSKVRPTNSFLGSTSHQIIERARIPIIVLPPEKRY